MNCWRVSVGFLILALLGIPALLPLLLLIQDPAGLKLWEDWQRLRSLAASSFFLAAGTEILALPSGVLLAILLYRTEFRLRGLFRCLLFMAIFIPLPVYATAWQTALGTSGWLPWTWWNTVQAGNLDVTASEVAWRAWGQGLGSAILVHSAAALPWVTTLVGLGLSWVEPALEEDALTMMPGGRVLWHVTLRRARGSIAAAGLWVLLMTWSEITVTDLFGVRTFAEEVYTQFVTAGDSLARAVAASLPALVLVVMAVTVVVQSWERRLPPLRLLQGNSRPLLDGKALLPLAAFGTLIVLIVVGVPFISLIWRMGAQGEPVSWSLALCFSHLGKAFKAQGILVLQSLIMAGAAGLATAFTALVCGWLSLEGRKFRLLLLVLAAMLWTIPGPLLGLGLFQTIQFCVDHVPSQFLAEALYYGPSPLPDFWAKALRYFPYALAMLWPVLRLFPPGLLDAARLDGMPPRQELTRLIVPLLLPATLRTAVGVGILAVGELSAGKLVGTPGSQTFAQELFGQMHYGTSNDVAALCCVLLIIVGACSLAYWLLHPVAAGRHYRKLPFPG